MRVFGAILFVAVALTGCADDEPQACTEIGCVDFLTLEFRSAEGEFQRGTYGLLLTVAGEEEERCEWEVQIACPGGGTCIVNETCDALHTPEAVTFEYQGKRTFLEYSLTRDGLRVAADEVTPEYETVRPNGPGCPPTCEHATEVVEVP